MSHSVGVTRQESGSSTASEQGTVCRQMWQSVLAIYVAIAACINRWLLANVVAMLNLLMWP